MDSLNFLIVYQRAATHTVRVNFLGLEHIIRDIMIFCEGMIKHVGGDENGCLGVLDGSLGLLGG